MPTFKSRYLMVSALLCLAAFSALLFAAMPQHQLAEADLAEVAILVPPYMMEAPAAGQPAATEFEWPQARLTSALPPAFFNDSGKDSSGASTAPAAPKAPAVVSPASVSAQPLAPVRPNRNLRPQIAIVIDDVGPDYRGARQVLTLDKSVTLAILPYAKNAREVATKARAKGHELLIHIPMEPEDLAHNNPGPDALLVRLSGDEIRHRLINALGSFDGYVGINNHMGSRFTEYDAGMRIVLAELAARNLLFLDSMTTSKSAAPGIAREMQINLATRNIFLDNVISADAIRDQLRQTEIYARRHGAAIAIGHPHAATLAVLSEWIPEAQRNGFELVPITALARRAGVVPAAVNPAPE